MTLSRDIAEYAHEITFRDLSEDVIAQTQKLVLDSLGCGISAFSSPPSKRLRSIYDSRQPVDSGATLLGTRNRVPVEYAGLLNASMVRYLDFNDCYSTGSSACHPSDHIPALISVAEAECASGKELIEAIVLAYEIQCRGVDTGAAWNNGFDYVTWGGYSSAIAVGKLMGLSIDEITNAIGIVGASSVGLINARLGEVSNWKGIAQPYATHNAIQACQMARGGVTGPEQIFEGDGGFIDAVSRGDPIEFDTLGGRNDSFRILETSFKKFACAYFNHPSITAVLDIVEDRGLSVDDIQSIAVETFDHAIQANASGPEKWASDLNRETADHSLPYTVSVAIMHGEVTPTQYSESHLTDEKLHQLMQKISAVSTEELNSYRRENTRHVPANVTVETTNDETFENRVNYPVGHPERPMSKAELKDKFLALIDGYLSDNQAAEVLKSCENLPRLATVDDLVENLVI